MCLDIPKLLYILAQVQVVDMCMPTHPDIVVSASCCQTSLAVRLKVS
jgi:hypothetical protein